MPRHGHLSPAGWNPRIPAMWAKLLGLVAVPMFGADRARRITGSHCLMLDGRLGSFVLSVANQQSPIQDFDCNRWAWSSNVTHSVTIEPDGAHAVVRRWDNLKLPQQFSLRREKDASTVFECVEESQPPAEGTTVIDRGLKTFQAVRDAMEEHGGLDLDTVIAFNTIVALVARYGDEVASLQIDFAHAILETNNEPPRITPALKGYALGDLARLLWEGDSSGRPYLLDADLLIRHASGALYEVAHRRLSQPLPSSRQKTLPGMLPLHIPYRRVPPPSDVHYTPPPLARALVEMAWRFLEVRRDDRPLDVLDPACGSGIFLIEMIREATARNDRGAITVRGFDESQLAVEVSNFCVAQAIRDARGTHITGQITRADSIATTWGASDIIVTNPPFISWEHLAKSRREAVENILGAFHQGRPDIACAFIMRALDSLRPGGVLACIVPPSFLERESAEMIRRYITESGEYQLRAVGHFQDFKFFSASVTPSFIVVSRSRVNPPTAVKIVTAGQGCAEKVIRRLRMLPWDEEYIEKQCEIYNVSSSSLSARRWMPLSEELRQLITSVGASTNTIVGDFFTPRMGIRTGDNKTFLLSESDYGALCRTKTERAFFRPVADHIVRAQVQRSGYVFYPYDESGNLLLGSEKEVAGAVPHFYGRRLKPAESNLKARVKYRKWWELTRPVATWLAARVPRLLSQAFGRAGNFAFDERGEYAVVQGVGWTWNASTIDKDILHAYLALLNSSVFDRLLEAFCPTLEGGQLELGRHFVEYAPLPDLAAAQARDALSKIGRAMTEGRRWDANKLERLCLRAYGLSSSGSPLKGKRSTSHIDRSKIGDLEDIEHETPEALAGIRYGTPTIYMKRRR